jgi:Transcription factor WhiB/Homeodomain-like domain
MNALNKNLHGPEKVQKKLFYPAADSGPARNVQVAAAKVVCRRCPVRPECLEEALARIPYGIAGGLTERERHRLRTTRYREHGRGDQGPRDGGLSAEAREALSDGPGRLRGRQRARVGRALLAAGRKPRQVAIACGVTERTVARWAALNTGTGAGTTGNRLGHVSDEHAGEGSTGATGLPSGSSQHATPQAGTRAPEGTERK